MSAAVSAAGIARLLAGIGGFAVLCADSFYPDRPHPDGETMSAFKKRRRARMTAAKAGGGAEEAPPKRAACDDCPPALRGLFKQGLISRRELRAAAAIARDYDMGYRSDVRITRYQEFVRGSGYSGSEECAAQVIDARARYDGARAAVPDWQWVYVFGVVIEKMARVKISGMADRFGAQKLRQAASAVVLVAGLDAIAGYYEREGWG